MLLREKPGAGQSGFKTNRPDDITEIAATAHLRLPWKDQIPLGIQRTGIEGYFEQRMHLRRTPALKARPWVQFDLNRQRRRMNLCRMVDLYPCPFTAIILVCMDIHNQTSATLICLRWGSAFYINPEKSGSLLKQRKTSS
jgi:hypothetical protein